MCDKGCVSVYVCSRVCVCVRERETEVKMFLRKNIFHSVGRVFTGPVVVEVYPSCD